MLLAGQVTGLLLYIGAITLLMRRKGGPRG